MNQFISAGVATTPNEEANITENAPEYQAQAEELTRAQAIEAQVVAEAEQDAADDREKRRTQAIELMYSNGGTIQDIQAYNGGEQYAKMLEPNTDQKYAHDAFAIDVAHAMTKHYEKEPVKAKLKTVETLKEMGFDTQDMGERTSLYNRVSNGATLSIVQALNGVKSFIGLSTSPDSPEYTRNVTELMETELNSMSMHDSELYSAMNPVRTQYVKALGSEEMFNETEAKTVTEEATDVGTQVGKELPSVALSFGTGAAAQMVARPTLKTVALLDGMTSTMLTSAKAAAETSNLTVEDIAMDAIASIVGYKVSPKGQARVASAGETLKSEQMPLNGTQIEELKDHLRKTNYGQNLANKLDEVDTRAGNFDESVREAVNDIIEQYQTNKARHVSEEDAFVAPAANIEGFTSLEKGSTGDDILEDLLDGHFINDPDKVHAAVDNRYNKINAPLIKSEYDKTYPMMLATEIDNPTQYIATLLAHEKQLIQTGNKSWVDFAKAIKAENSKELVYRLGMNGVLTMVHLPGGAASFLMSSSLFKNWFNNVYKSGKIVKPTADVFKAVVGDAKKAYKGD